MILYTSLANLLLTFDIHKDTSQITFICIIRMLQKIGYRLTKNPHRRSRTETSEEFYKIRISNEFLCFVIFFIPSNVDG